MSGGRSVSSGQACMGDAILRAAEIVEKRKQDYRDNGVDYYRPWIFMITGGNPTDMQPGDEKWDQVRLIVHNGERNKKFAFFVAVPEEKNFSHMAEIAPPNRVPMKFEWSRIEDLSERMAKETSF